MFILSFLGDFLTHIILVAGIILFLAGTTLGMIPFFKTYKIPAQLLGLILMSSGLYYEGKLAHKKEIEKQVADLKVKLATAEVRSHEINTKIITKYIRDKQVIREKGDRIIKYIDREVVKYDNACIIPKDVIDIYNEAAVINSDPAVPALIPAVPPAIDTAVSKTDTKVSLPARTSK